MKRRLDFVIPSLDMGREREFIARCKPLLVTIELRNKHNPRIAYWHMFDPKTEAVRTSGFDIDVTRTLDRMEAGASLAQVDLYAARPTASAISRSHPGNLTGGPFCVVCENAGGLPCPKMVKQALGLNIRLAFPPGDVRLLPTHVHPGHCRKRLKTWISTGSQLTTTKKT